MFQAGDRIKVSVIEDGSEGPTTHYNMIVVEFADGLLKVQQDQTTTVYNMRSRNFVSATLQR